MERVIDIITVGDYLIIIMNVQSVSEMFTLRSIININYAYENVRIHRSVKSHFFKGQMENI